MNRNIFMILSRIFQYMLSISISYIPFFRQFHNMLLTFIDHSKKHLMFRVYFHRTTWPSLLSATNTHIFVFVGVPMDKSMGYGGQPEITLSGLTSSMSGLHGIAMITICPIYHGICAVICSTSIILPTRSCWLRCSCVQFRFYLLVMSHPCE